jgi:hypothetical protein
MSKGVPASRENFAVDTITNLVYCQPRNPGGAFYSPASRHLSWSIPVRAFGFCRAPFTSRRLHDPIPQNVENRVVSDNNENMVRVAAFLRSGATRHFAFSNTPFLFRAGLIW